jgi:hypothetical protein
MAKRVRLTAVQAADKHIRRTTAATQDMREGIERVTEAPTLLAADKIGKMRTKWLAALESGKIERGLRRVTLGEWKAAMLEKGVGRVADGVTAARPKLESFYSDLFAYEDNLLGQIDGMADLSLEDSIQRMRAWALGMSKFTRS